ncbi:MAG TPA: VWA domain-containing protein [Pyrinomonadaceae bacterium]|nr:VWA domain-containing protein [Pyrinomonadaceae bacterium]
MKTGNFFRQRIILSAVLFLSALAPAFLPQNVIAQRKSNANQIQHDEEINVNTDLITLNVSVTDKTGRAVTGLDKNNFDIYDNKELQEIHFFSDADVPASVSIVFDTSGSMSEGKLIQAKEALARFVRTSKAEDEFFLVDFNTRAQLLLNRTRDSDAVLKKLSYVEPKGNTAFYDAVYLGVEKVLQGSRTRKIVLVISDGEDNESRYSFKELQQRLKETDVIIYAIGFGGYYPLKGGLNGRGTLEELARATGGRAFFPNGAVEMDEAFEKIALEMRHLYSIGYYPSNFIADGKMHRLKIKLSLPAGSPRLVVRSREVYYEGVN